MSTWPFLKFHKTTCTVETVTWGQEFSDMGHGNLLNSTRNQRNSKRQRHQTLEFIKIDMRHQDPTSRAPVSIKDIILELIPYVASIRLQRPVSIFA